MGGIEDHRGAGRHRLLEALQHQRSDLDPGSVHARIAEQLGADRIGGKHQGRLAGFALEQRGEVTGQGGLAAA
ncbi:MAG: hypothetical protein NT158_03760, partial [Cyanobacteria bacterium]|nr:hypothetical protein [Cyanobacteriota bacterium]